MTITPPPDLVIATNSQHALPRHVLGWIAVYTTVSDLRIEDGILKYYDADYNIDCFFTLHPSIMSPYRTMLRLSHVVTACYCRRRSNGQISACVYTQAWVRFKCWGSFAFALWYAPVTTTATFIAIPPPPPHPQELSPAWCL